MFRPWSCLWGNGGAFLSTVVLGAGSVGHLRAPQHHAHPSGTADSWVRPHHPLATGQALHLLPHLILPRFSDFQFTDKESGHLARLEDEDRIASWSWCSSSWRLCKPGSTATLVQVTHWGLLLPADTCQDTPRREVPLPCGLPEG